MLPFWSMAQPLASSGSMPPAVSAHVQFWAVAESMNKNIKKKNNIFWLVIA
jgi:hypothetical protein